MDRADFEAEWIRKISKDSTDIMLKVNRERGSCSQEIGLLGLFLEVRTMYLRLRSLAWDQDPPDLKEEKEEWIASIRNALQDLRNYTILAEIALLEDNMKGIGDDSKLKKRKDIKICE